MLGDWPKVRVTLGQNRDLNPEQLQTALMTTVLHRLCIFCLRPWLLPLEGSGSKPEVCR